MKPKDVAQASCQSIQCARCSQIWLIGRYAEANSVKALALPTILLVIAPWIVSVLYYLCRE